MSYAICWKCVDDEYLKQHIRDNGGLFECSVCGNAYENAISVADLGILLEPRIRENFSLGEEIKVFHGEEDDNGSWEQEGEPLSWAVQEVLGQYFDFEDEIVQAVIDAEDVWPPDGDVPFFDDTSNYVESRVALSHYYAEWEALLEELKHKRRFFSPSAHTLFGKLFGGVEEMKARPPRTTEAVSVVRNFPEGSELFRARICNSQDVLVDVFSDPLKHAGPPPESQARTGRMNADGVVVFYGAEDLETCLAEMRPVIGNDLAVIRLRTTKPLRLLDFSLLEYAYAGTPLSYFQPDFTDEVEKRAFRRRLHRLISQPIIPGKETEYLITQTMAEYLAHVHKEPFDGVLFASAQRADGKNVVLFSDPAMITDQPSEAFGLAYCEDSLQIFTTTSISYSHHKRDAYGMPHHL
ncbi:MAG: RES domain-containing protein [Gammaproteobacteria bacterium]|nr:RES domain-containing protein [Gammaproteobacteria bacterium]MBU1644753.1 RES domain-containing protein [Gammaproteobacteria bacterium]MBU1973487.1 RES domain-containing protein [Gammaproteobacteria bacterium]